MTQLRENRKIDTGRTRRDEAVDANDAPKERDRRTTSRLTAVGF